MFSAHHSLAITLPKVGPYAMFRALKSFLGEPTAEKVVKIDPLNGRFQAFYDFFDLMIARHGSGESKAQIKQDIFVLMVLGWKRQGYFVEFGATDGVGLSNTHLLEKEFGWDGILAEPAPVWHDALRRNRSVHIDLDCVWRDTGRTVPFNVVSVAELSTISRYSSNDTHKDLREDGVIHQVRTISLRDLLKKYNAPRTIDYLSVDTEGSEYDILKAFDFSEYSFRVITVEHNFTPMREKIFALLTGLGYSRVLEDVSQWDDWYIRKEDRD